MEDDWKQRVVNEHWELCGRLVKLSIFISTNSSFTAIEAYQQVLLRRQQKAMVEYEVVLAERIKSFG